MSRISLIPLALLATVLALVLAACGSDDEPAASGAGRSDAPLKVGASPLPHAEVLQFVADELAPKAGLELEVVPYDDYIQPNVALHEGKLDANYFQHKPYLEQQIKDNPDYREFVALDAVHLEPLGIYSKKVDDVSRVREGATVTLSNDPSNAARGLRLLEQAGLIELAPDAGLDATPRDVADNPKGLEFRTIAPANLPRTLDDADLAVINGNYALQAGLTPARDALVIEKATGNPYANLLVTRKDEAADPRLKKLDELLHSPEVKRFIERQYKGSVIAAF